MGLFRKGKTCIIGKFDRTDLVFCSHFREKKMLSYSQINMVREYFEIPYFSAYKTEAFPFQNNPKNLDPSYKMDLDLGDCLGRAKFVL